MALFARTHLDPDLKRLAAGRRVLAPGASAEGQVGGLVDALVFKQDGEWREQSWHRIERGSWDATSHSLSWLDVDGVEWRLELTEPGRLPDFFNERVTASIACVRTVELDRGRTALITARRELGDSSRPLIWRVAPGKGVSVDELADNPLLALTLEQLRAEFDVT
ncbi:MAG TPA: hypothetical protein PKV13_07090 [Propionicimonas sp.]|nr:hypothetical protein [Propionicimonas sp.]HRA06370.1 hypothetical protein [Propionicimonas sp.]